VALIIKNVQWGDVATWIGGLGTAFALYLTYRLLLITRQEHNAQQAEHRQEQARHVSAWCSSVVASDNGLHSVTVTVQNSSDEPIYGARVAVGSSWLGNAIRYAEPELSYVLPPKYKKAHTVALRLEPLPGGGDELSPPVEVIFNDATGGRLWRRDLYGGLMQIDGGPPGGAGEHFFKPTATQDS
jgi:hypothetical protein